MLMFKSSPSAKTRTGLITFRLPFLMVLTTSTGRLENPAMPSTSLAALVAMAEITSSEMTSSPMEVLVLISMQKTLLCCQRISRCKCAFIIT
jgi:hypothetical protein